MPEASGDLSPLPHRKTNKSTLSLSEAEIEALPQDMQDYVEKTRARHRR